MVALMVVFMVAAVLSVDWGVRAYRRNRGWMTTEGPRVLPLPEWAKLPVEALSAPAGLLYGSGHTWLSIRDNGALRVGIDDFLNHAVGPVQEIDFLVTGAQVKRGGPVARLKQDGVSVWVRSPIDGRVKSNNYGLLPNLLKLDPYGSGWLVELEGVNSMPNLAGLRFGKSVKSWFKDEALRFGRFLTGLSPNPVPTLQDGGDPVAAKLSAMGPESAAAFERAFLMFPEES